MAVPTEYEDDEYAICLACGRRLWVGRNGKIPNHWPSK